MLVGEANTDLNRERNSVFAFSLGRGRYRPRTEWTSTGLGRFFKTGCGLALIFVGRNISSRRIIR
jgi:hypothetical protein